MPRLTALFGKFTLPGNSLNLCLKLLVCWSPNLVRTRSTCASYRLILEKILANFLSQVLGDLVHVGQISFMLRKGTDINICHLFLNLLTTHCTNCGTRVIIASLDAEMAFDSVECFFYLWEVMFRFWFGPRFLMWLLMLFQAPRENLNIT